MAILLGILGLLVIIAGLALAWWGWSRRTGNSPHCGKCDANLAGIWEGHCPHCRKKLTEYNVAIGRWTPYWQAVTFGSVLAVSGLLSIVAAGVVLAFDKDRPLDAVKPTFMVISEAETAVDSYQPQTYVDAVSGVETAAPAEASPASRALTTLMSRVYREALTDAQEQEAGDVLIAAVVRGRTMGGADADIADAASQILARNNLNEEQTTTLLKHLGAVEARYNAEANTLQLGGASVLPMFDRKHDSLYMAVHYLVKPIAVDGVSVDEPAGEIVLIAGPEGVVEWRLKWVNIHPMRSIDLAVATGWYRLPADARKMMLSRRRISQEKDRKSMLAAMERLGAKPIARSQEHVVLTLANGWSVPVHILPPRSEADYVGP